MLTKYLFFIIIYTKILFLFMQHFIVTCITKLYYCLIINKNIKIINRTTIKTKNITIILKYG